MNVQSPNKYGLSQEEKERAHALRGYVKDKKGKRIIDNEGLEHTYFVVKNKLFFVELEPIEIKYSYFGCDRGVVINEIS